LLETYEAPTGKQIKNFRMFDDYLSVVVFNNTNDYGSEVMNMNGSKSYVDLFTAQDNCNCINNCGFYCGKFYCTKL